MKGIEYERQLMEMCDGRNHGGGVKSIDRCVI